MVGVMETIFEPLNGPMCWTGVELASRDDWALCLDAEAAAELAAAAARLADRPVVSITAADAPLPKTAATLNRLKTLAANGPGVALLRGVPTESAEAAARALWLIGIHIGLPQPQDAAGGLLHDIRDTGADPDNETDVRVYQTALAQPFHNDGGDLFLLLCRRPAVEGGESRIVSAPALFNAVLARRPELAAVLQQPFPFDARGNQLPGRPPYQQLPIFSARGENIFILHKRHYIDYAMALPGVPPLTDEQIAALDLVDDICADPSFQYSFRMVAGDLIIGNNFTTLHARDAFADPGGPSGRHMMRLWIGLADGPKLPGAFRETREFGALFDIPGRA